MLCFLNEQVAYIDFQTSTPYKPANINITTKTHMKHFNIMRKRKLILNKNIGSKSNNSAQTLRTLENIGLLVFSEPQAQTNQKTLTYLKSWSQARTQEITSLRHRLNSLNLLQFFYKRLHLCPLSKIISCYFKCR